MHPTERIIHQLARLARRGQVHPDAEVPLGFATALLASLRGQVSAEMLWRSWSVRSALTASALAVMLWVALPEKPTANGDWAAMLLEETNVEGGFEP